MWVDLTKGAENVYKLVSNANAHQRARRSFIIKWVKWLILWTLVCLFAWFPHSSHRLMKKVTMVVGMVMHWISNMAFPLTKANWLNSLVSIQSSNNKYQH